MAQISNIININRLVFDVVDGNTERKPRKSFTEERCLKDIYFSQIEQILNRQ